MMTIRRFRRLADSYGADLQRWPERLRYQALALLDASAEARDIIARAGELDDTIATAAAARSESLWSGDRPEAALVRLRNGLTMRLGQPRSAAASGTAPTRIRTARDGVRRLRWLGLATAASVAIAAGVVLGALYSQAAAAPHPDLLTLLQPSPIQLLTD